MTDARRSPRLRCVQKAEISFAGGAFRQECLVRDISEIGARLVLSDGFNVPAEFDITLPNRPDVTRAVVRWRRDSQIGVEFLDHVASSVLKSASVTTEEKLEAALAENARLVKTIAELNETVATMKKQLTRFTVQEALRAS